MEIFSFSRKEKDSNEKVFYKLMNDQDLVDVTLVCDDGKQIKAHKVILSGGSQFFKTIFSSSPHQHPLIYLFGIEWVNLVSAVEFLYLGETTVLECNLKHFLDTAEKLRILGITSQQTCKTPQLVKSYKINVPDKDILEEQTSLTISKYLKARGERSDMPELDNYQTMMRTIENNLETRVLTTDPANNYNTGYYTSSPASSNEDQISQKESLEKLRKSFDRYELEKSMRPKEQCGVKFNRIDCDICGYRALSKEDLRLHRLGFHCKY